MTPERPRASSPAESPLLYRMPVVRLHNDDGVLAFAAQVYLRNHLADQLVHRGEESGILVTWMRKLSIPVVGSPFRGSLQGIVGPVDGPVDKERALVLGADYSPGLLDHEITETCSIVPNLCSITPEVVAVRAIPVEEVGKVVDTPSHVSKGSVKALAVRHGFICVAEVPLANMVGPVSSLLEGLRKEIEPRREALATPGGGNISGGAQTHGYAAPEQSCPRG